MTKRRLMLRAAARSRRLGDNDRLDACRRGIGQSRDWKGDFPTHLRQLSLDANRLEQNRPESGGHHRPADRCWSDYTYSETLRQRKTEWQIWDEAALDVYLRNAREAVHGVKMFFKGLPAQSDRLDIIAYLQTLK